MDGLSLVRQVTGLAVLARTWLRDEEAAGSNPATPTEKLQADGIIAKCGDHAIDRWLAIRWRDRTSVRGMRRGGSAGNATAAGHRPSRVEQASVSLLWHVRR
jgi:hypothetical protein